MASPGSTFTMVRSGPAVSPGISTAIGGFRGTSRKGPLTPQLITSPEEFKSMYGARVTALPYLYDAVTSFFEQGGASCYVSRAIGSGSASAERTINAEGGATSGSTTSNPSTFPASLASGDTFIGKVDGGSPVTITLAAAAASITGAAATYAAVTASHTLVVNIAGVAGNQTITFDGSENTQAKFHAAINDQIDGAKASNSSGQTKLITDVLGTDAAGSVVSGDSDVLASLGLSVAAFTAGTGNVGNVKAVTAAELKTLFDANYTGSTSTANSNGSLTWASDATGTGSIVQFTGGTGRAKIAGFDTSAHAGTTTADVPALTVTASSAGEWGNSESVAATRVDTVVTTVPSAAAGSTTTLTLASVAKVFVGDTLSITKSADTQRGVVKSISGKVVTFVAAITVPGGGYSGQNVVSETFTLSTYDESGKLLEQFGPAIGGLRASPLAAARYYVNYVNSFPGASIAVADESPVASDPRPQTDSAAVAMSGGLDGSAPTASEWNGSSAAGTGWWSFDNAVDVNFLSAPGVCDVLGSADGATVLLGLESYCQTRGDVQSVLEGPSNLTPASTGTGSVGDFVTSVANLAGEQLAFHYPWYKAVDPDTGLTISVPPSGYIQGMIARVHRTRNFGKAPAGIVDGQIVGIKGLVTEVTTAQYDLLYPLNINCTLKFPGQGYAVWGSRTLDPTGEFGQFNVVTVFNVAKREGKKLTRFANFEFNDGDTRGSVERVLSSLFREWRKARILAGAKDEEAFYVICTVDNNPPSVVRAGKLRCRIGLAVNVPVEFQEFTLEIDTRALNA